MFPRGMVNEQNISRIYGNDTITLNQITLTTIWET